jgi:hypothetical protein
VSAYVFIALLLLVIFAVDTGWRWWRQNAWRYHRRDEDDDDTGMPTA